jgi:hypothetical protein
MNYAKIIPVFVIIVIAALIVSANNQNEDKGMKYLVPPEEIVSGGPPKDGIPPIDNPQFVSADYAEEFLNNDTMGIFVKNGGETKFYPYNIMLWHEIVNDNVGGKPLTVTFCPLCATGIVFDRTIDEKVYDFGTSGKLYKSNLVMYDRQTNSYWSQALGMSIAGEMAGTNLTVVPFSIIDFDTAAKNNPGMLVLSTDTGYKRDYTFNPYSDYENSDYVNFGIDFSDRRLPSKTMVYGIIVDGTAKAYDYFKLLNASEITDTVAGHELDISVDRNKEIIVLDRTKDERVIGIVSFWFSWAIHNEDTELWTG